MSDSNTSSTFKNPANSSSYLKEQQKPQNSTDIREELYSKCKEIHSNLEVDIADGLKATAISYKSDNFEDCHTDSRLFETLVQRSRTSFSTITKNKTLSQSKFTSIYKEKAFTSRINPVSQETMRSVDNLLTWRVTVEKKKEVNRKLKDEIEIAAAQKKSFVTQKSQQIIAKTRPQMPIEDLLLKKEQQRLEKIQRLTEQVYGGLGTPRITKKASKLKPQEDVVTRLYEAPKRNKSKERKSSTVSRSTSPSIKGEVRDPKKRLGHSASTKVLPRTCETKNTLPKQNTIENIYKNYAEKQAKDKAPALTDRANNSNKMESTANFYKQVNGMSNESFNRHSYEPAAVNETELNFDPEQKPRTQSAEKSAAQVSQPMFRPPISSIKKKFIPTFNMEKLRLSNFMFFGNQTPNEYLITCANLSRINTDPSMSDDKWMLSGLSPLLNPRISTTRDHKEISSIFEKGARTARPHSNSEFSAKNRKVTKELKTEVNPVSNQKISKTLKNTALEPTKSIVERSKDWLQSKNTKLSEKRADQQKKERDSCTFQPQILKKTALANETRTLSKDFQPKALMRYSEIQSLLKKKTPSKPREKLAGVTDNEIKGSVHECSNRHFPSSFLNIKTEESNDNLSKESNEDSDIWNSVYQHIEKQKQLLNHIIQNKAETK